MDEKDTTGLDLWSGSINLGGPKTRQEKEINLLPDRYRWEPSQRDGLHMGITNVGENLSRPTLILPVIDLKHDAMQDPSSRKRLATEVGLAAEEFGFFQVKNHGVPVAVIEKMMSFGREIFKLPMEIKERALNLDPKKNSYYQGYHGRFQHLQKQVPWLEVFGENERPVSELENLAKALWPESNGNLSFCQCVREYNEALCELGRQVLALLAEHLDLGSDYFSKHFSEERPFQSNWRYNHYPPCPRPDLTVGVAPHTDPNAITILTQDEVGGFQYRKHNFWFDVEPARDTLLVNIGDTLQAWTNGRLQSAWHRAVVNEKSARLSIVYFLSPPENTFLAPHSSFINADHGLRDSNPAWSHTFRSRKLYDTASCKQ